MFELIVIALLGLILYKLCTDKDSKSKLVKKAKAFLDKVGEE